MSLEALGTSDGPMALPVRAIERDVVAALAASNRLVLTAPTGSGKSTQAPQMLLAHPSVTGRVIVLQPRRLAARLLARRVAEEVDLPLGGLVGFHTRHERAVSSETRLIFMTEGVLLRQMQSRPTLPGIGAVVLDEFHERSIHADVLLGMIRRLQEAQRPDLRLLVMSATLDAGGLAGYLGCRAMEAHGRAFPVEIAHLPARSAKAVWDLAAAAVRDVLDTRPDGDVLVFMPGAYEIRRTLQACRAVLGAGEAVSLRPLHGALPPGEQDAALAPLPRGGGRRVIVATNVAETSITIEGVRHVIDSGLARTHRYDPRRGVNVLQTGPISRASATQRAGRAGRTAPGTCLRLWPKQEHAGRAAQDVPEVQRLDLAEPMLQLKSLGIADIAGFPWLDPPSPAAVERSGRLLAVLGAIDKRGDLTEAGRKMARFPLHPRLARMLLEAARRHCLGRALTWAALASERDIVSDKLAPRLREVPPDEPASDLAARERALAEAERLGFASAGCRSLGVDAAACREVQRTRKLIAEAARREGLAMAETGTVADLAECLVAGFPDHVAMCGDLQTRRCQLPGQKRVVLDRESLISRPGPLVALEVRELARAGDAATVLSLCTELDAARLLEMGPPIAYRRRVVEWNDERQRVEEVEEAVFAELVLDRTHRPAPPELSTPVLVERIVRGELTLAAWDEQVDQWIERVRCLSQWFPERALIGYDREDMAVILHEALAGAATANEARNRPLLESVRGALSWDDRRWVEGMAPGELQLPTGRKMKLVYRAGQVPRGRAKIQDLFGMGQSPRVAGGRVGVLIEILAPNFRPVQVTDDLANFWATLYPRLRRELSRRYPRHEWR